MAEEIAFENGQISNSEGLVALTLDQVILHIIMYHSLIVIIAVSYTPNFINIEQTFCRFY